MKIYPTAIFCQIGSDFCQILKNRQYVAKVVIYFAKLKKLRQIWSDWTQPSLSPVLSLYFLETINKVANCIMAND